jgi:hypothetical protein
VLNHISLACNDTCTRQKIMSCLSTSSTPRRNQGVPRTWPAELGTELASVCGGVAALAHGGWPTQAMMAAKEARTSTARWRRCWCPRPKRERERRELQPRAPANSGHGGQRRGETPNRASPLLKTRRWCASSTEKVVETVARRIGGGCGR